MAHPQPWFLGPRVLPGESWLPGALPTQCSTPRNPLISCPLPTPSPIPVGLPAPTYITASILQGGALTFAALSGRVAGLDHIRQVCVAVAVCVQQASLLFRSLKTQSEGGQYWGQRGSWQVLERMGCLLTRWTTMVPPP